MYCQSCGRELKEDANFCDNCGYRILQEKTEKEFNYKTLIFGILASIAITLIVTGSAGAMGFPLIFGGLFLPFFWNLKKKDE